MKIWDAKNVSEPKEMARATSILRRITCQAQARHDLVMQWLEGFYGRSMPTPAGKTPPPPEGELPSFIAPTPMPPSPPPALEAEPPELQLLHAQPPTPPFVPMPLHAPEFYDPFREVHLPRRNSFVVEAPSMAPRRHSDSLLTRRHSVYPLHSSTPSSYFPTTHLPSPSLPMAPMSTGYSMRSVRSAQGYAPPPPHHLMLAPPPSPNLPPYPGPFASPLAVPFTSHLAHNFTGSSHWPSPHFDLNMERPLRAYDRMESRRPRSTGGQQRRGYNNPKSRRSASVGAALPSEARRPHGPSPPMGGKKGASVPVPSRWAKLKKLSWK